MQASFKELSPAKINLFLKIVSKREDGYHNLRSGITLINLYDEVSAEKSLEFKVKYIGKFAPPNSVFEDCSSLSIVDMSSVTYIRNDAFRN